jgi:short-subunit dehydrogenase
MRGRRRKGLLLAAGVGLGLLGREALGRWRSADLYGDVALVTGGSRGLGYLLARELAREGCRLAICARDEQELTRAQRALEEEEEGAEVFALPCDISDRAQVERLVDETTRHYGQIDILVNNAGIIQVGPVAAMTVEDFETAVGVMFWGVVYPTLAVLPQMRERRSGRIVTITSIGGKVSVPQLLPYNCAKFAAVGFSEGLRAEAARDGITVTTIAPGLMRTGSHLNAWFKGNQERMYALFAPAASLPLVSMDAERAARQIVEATKRGEGERILSLPATALATFHGLFPGLTADLFGLVNRVLPSAQGATGAVTGHEARARLQSPLLDKLTTLGESAARRFHQYPDAEPPPAAEQQSAPGQAPGAAPAPGAGQRPDADEPPRAETRKPA